MRIGGPARARHVDTAAGVITCRLSQHRWTDGDAHAKEGDSSQGISQESIETEGSEA
jgi:hypothetical protein